MWKSIWTAPYWAEAAADTEQPIPWKELNHWDVLVTQWGWKLIRTFGGDISVPVVPLSVTWRGDNSSFLEAVQYCLVNSSCAWRGDPWSPSSTTGSSIMFWTLDAQQGVLKFFKLSSPFRGSLPSFVSCPFLCRAEPDQRKIRIIQRAEGCSLPQMVQAWIAVKELNLLQRLTSSTGAGEEQALRTQEKKNTQYGKMPTAWLASETVKLSVGFLEGGWEMQRCGNRESSSRRCPTGRKRRPALGDTIWSFVCSASCLVGIKDRRKPVCEIMVVTEQHLRVSGLFHRVGLIQLLSA